MICCTADGNVCPDESKPAPNQTKNSYYVKLASTLEKELCIYIIPQFWVEPAVLSRITCPSTAAPHAPHAGSKGHLDDDLDGLRRRLFDCQRTEISKGWCHVGFFLVWLEREISPYIILHPHASLQGPFGCHPQSYGILRASKHTPRG